MSEKINFLKLDDDRQTFIDKKHQDLMEDIRHQIANAMMPGPFGFGFRAPLTGKDQMK